MVITFHSQGLLIYRYLILFLVNLLPSGLLILLGQFLLNSTTRSNFMRSTALRGEIIHQSDFFQSGKVTNIQV